MNEKPDIKREKDRTGFRREVGAKAARKLKAQRNPAPGVWFGLGMMGIVGWSVAVPDAARRGARRIWLDDRHPGGHSWTLALLVAGLCDRLFQCVALGGPGRPGHAGRTGG